MNRYTQRGTLKKVLTTTFVFVVFFPFLSHAASTTWTQYEPGTWWYLDTNNHGAGARYEPGLINPTVQISYYATITDTDNGQVLAQGASVPVGTHLSLEFTPHQSQDIYWFGTGESFDSPYGEWEANAAPPALACNQQDYVGTYSDLGQVSIDVYVPFAVSPPDETLSNTNGLSCGNLVPSPDGGMAAACTANSPGSANPNFNYGTTQGMFYYRWDYSSDCVANNAPMTTDPAAGGGTLYYGWMYAGGSQVPGSPVSVPVQSIPYPLTITDSNPNPNPSGGPNPPGVTPDTSETSSCSTDGAPSYDISGTDSNSSAQVRYGISWDDSNTVEQWAPATGYVSEGTKETVEQAGSNSTFEVITEDSSGNDSGWTTVTAATCSSCPDGTVSENGECVSVSCPTGYSEQNGSCVFTSCPAGDTQKTDGSGNVECVEDACSPRYICQNGNLYYEDGSCNSRLSQSCSYGCSSGTCVNSPTAAISAQPALVRSGNTTEISWRALGVSSCTIDGSNGQIWSCTGASCAATTTELSDSIIGRTSYVLSCTGLDNSTLTKSATVDIVPGFCETGAPNCP